MATKTAKLITHQCFLKSQFVQSQQRRFFTSMRKDSLISDSLPVRMIKSMMQCGDIVVSRLGQNKSQCDWYDYMHVYTVCMYSPSSIFNYICDGSTRLSGSSSCIPHTLNYPIKVLKFNCLLAHSCYILHQWYVVGI